MSLTVIAHRSGPCVFPEQTVESGLDALGKGADLVEVDVRLSADGELMISHDPDIKRVFGVDRETASLTGDEFRRLIRPDGFHGYLLEDYVSAGVLPLLVHIKEEPAVEPLLSFIRARSIEDKIVPGAHSPAQIEEIKKAAPSIKVLAFMRSASDLDACIAAGAEHIRLWDGWYTRELRDRIHAAGRHLWIMTGGASGFPVGYCSQERLDFFVNEGVDGILINEVEKLTGR